MTVLSYLRNILAAFRSQRSQLTKRRSPWNHGAIALCLVLLIGWQSLTPATALAGVKDDRYEGDIFALFAGNGSLVPPRVTLKEAFQRQRPTLLVFYIDDSSDCKEYAPVISQLQGFYGRAVDFILLRVDALTPKANYEKTEPGYYYKGFVPQTVVFDAAGKVMLNQAGNLSFEQIDDVFRDVFNLLPRAESVELKRRSVNEINTELVKE